MVIDFYLIRNCLLHRSQICLDTAEETHIDTYTVFDMFALFLRFCGDYVKPLQMFMKYLGAFNASSTKSRLCRQKPHRPVVHVRIKVLKRTLTVSVFIIHLM